MSPAETPGVDLAAYLARIGYSGPRGATVEVLAALHQAHAARIPFENLDIVLGVPIRIDLPSLEAKLVRGGRGGYCFEHNTLFAAVLEQLGFRVERLAARVRMGGRRVAPRTHMLLRVTVDGESFLADVGFGAEGLSLPIPHGLERETALGAWTYRVVRQALPAGAVWVLQSRRTERWEDLYSFTLEPQEAVDFEVANYFTSTHPESWFRRTATAQLSAPEERRILRGRELTVDRGREVTRRMLAPDEVRAVLAEVFGLHLPALPGEVDPLLREGEMNAPPGAQCPLID